MKKSYLGFTLIELLVVTSIIGVIFAIGVVQYMNFNRSQILEQSAQELRNNLRLAQTLALSGEKPWGCDFLDGYQVSFASGNPDSYAVRAICGGVATGVPKTFSLPSVVKFSSIPSPILFKVLGQGTNLTDDLTISLVGFGISKQIIVTKTGKIE